VHAADATARAAPMARYKIDRVHPMGAARQAVPTAANPISETDPPTSRIAGGRYQSVARVRAKNHRSRPRRSVIPT
jgi:hypothetical protein